MSILQRKEWRAGEVKEPRLELHSSEAVELGFKPDGLIPNHTL